MKQLIELCIAWLLLIAGGLIGGLAIADLHSGREFGFSGMEYMGVKLSAIILVLVAGLLLRRHIRGSYRIRGPRL